MYFTCLKIEFSELKTLEWDILNSDLPINLEINKIGEQAIFNLEINKRGDQAMILISTILKFSAQV